MVIVSGLFSKTNHSVRLNTIQSRINTREKKRINTKKKRINTKIFLVHSLFFTEVIALTGHDKVPSDSVTMEFFHEI